MSWTVYYKRVPLDGNIKKKKKRKKKKKEKRRRVVVCENVPWFILVESFTHKFTQLGLQNDFWESGPLLWKMDLWKTCYLTPRGSGSAEQRRRSRTIRLPVFSDLGSGVEGSKGSGLDGGSRVRTLSWCFGGRSLFVTDRVYESIVQLSLCVPQSHCPQIVLRLYKRQTCPLTKTTFIPPFLVSTDYPEPSTKIKKQSLLEVRVRFLSLRIPWRLPFFRIYRVGLPYGLGDSTYSCPRLLSV